MDNWAEIHRSEGWWGTPADQRYLLIFTPSDDTEYLEKAGVVTYASLKHPHERIVFGARAERAEG